MNPPLKLSPADQDEAVCHSDRRRFLGQLCIGSMGVTLASTLSETSALAETNLAQSSSPADRKKIRLGVVGGRFGARFQFHEHPDCTVAAVSDLRPERRKKLQEVYRCDQAYDSLEELVLDKSI